MAFASFLKGIECYNLERLRLTALLGQLFSLPSLAVEQFRNW
jgi:hypothetical protein